MPQAWSFEGPRVRVDDVADAVPPYNKEHGSHLWVVTPMFRVDALRLAHEPGFVPYLDRDTLLYITPVFCFYCEQPASERLLLRRCVGEPR